MRRKLVIGRTDTHVPTPPLVALPILALLLLPLLLLLLLLLLVALLVTWPVETCHPMYVDFVN